MVNFWAPPTIPERYRGRLFYEHNPHVQLPHFITPEFWHTLRERVFQEFDVQIERYGLHAVT